MLYPLGLIRQTVGAHGNTFHNDCTYVIIKLNWNEYTVRIQYVCVKQGLEKPKGSLCQKKSPLKNGLSPGNYCGAGVRKQHFGIIKQQSWQQQKEMLSQQRQKYKEMQIPLMYRLKKHKIINIPHNWSCVLLFFTMANPSGAQDDLEKEKVNFSLLLHADTNST